MAKIIELMGSPGVGKTTIYNQIRANWKKNYNWIPEEMLFPKEKLLSEKYSVSILNILRLIFLNKEKYDVAAIEEAGSRFVNFYPEYIDKCWHNIDCIYKKNLDRADLRFQKMAYLNKLIQKIQIIREQTTNQIAIVDEGLVHLIANFLSEDKASLEVKKEIKKFLQIMPLPDGVISVETTLEENTLRLLQRKKIISMHKSLIKSQLEKIMYIDHQRREAVNNVLKAQEIPVLRINSSDKINLNVVKILDFAEDLHAK